MYILDNPFHASNLVCVSLSSEFNDARERNEYLAKDVGEYKVSPMSRVLNLLPRYVPMATGHEENI
jgi:hypothetical protein